MKGLKYQVFSSPFLHVTVLREGTKQNKLATELNHSINLPYKLPGLKGSRVQQELHLFAYKVYG